MKSKTAQQYKHNTYGDSHILLTKYYLRKKKNLCTEEKTNSCVILWAISFGNLVVKVSSRMAYISFSVRNNVLQRN